MHPFYQIYNKEERIVAGLMSGTSLDGIDTALVKIFNSGKNTHFELIDFQTTGFTDQLRAKLSQISQAGSGSVDDICRIDTVLAEYYLDAVCSICEKSKIKISDLDLIGTHGQTIHHLPNAEKYLGKNSRSTFQIGNPALIASRSGVITVGNFRQADIALGGQGAPLVPYVDYILFRSEEFDRVLLNIGGIANITILPAGCREKDVLAYDTGPGNMVINRLMEILYEKPFDNNGELACKGDVSKSLLSDLLENPYFKKPAPKSTGREEFGENFCKKVLRLSAKLKLRNEDIVASATELTALTIMKGIELSNLPQDTKKQLIVSGGGIHNKVIMNSLKRKLKNASLKTSDRFGIPADAKEAICFAILANETIAGKPANLPSVTGASRKSILGAVYFP